MARMARVVVPFYPHHVTQQGNRRQRTFFGDFDYKIYLELMSEFCCKADTRVWTYCLMPNHVHLVMVPSHLDGLHAVLGESHRRYTRAVNFRKRWRGHLWQERFHSFPMDEAYLLAAVRYVEQNPVAARLCQRAQDWPWSARRRTCADGTMDWWRFSRCCHESTIGRRIYWMPERTISGYRFPRIPAPAGRWVTRCSFTPLNESQAGR